MSDIINRTQRDQGGCLLRIYSVNTPDYPVEIWVINPDLLLLEGIVPCYYWKNESGTDFIVEMPPEEKAVVDTTLLASTKVNKKAALAQNANYYQISNNYTESDIINLQIIYENSTRLRPNRTAYLLPWIAWRDAVTQVLRDAQALVDAATTITDVNNIWLDTSPLDALDPIVTVAAALAVVDDMTLSNYLNANATVTDPVTGISGPFDLMELLLLRTDMYNDTENPLYHAGQGAILGSGGYLVDHANRIANLETVDASQSSRINNLETIHGKLGWHNQQVLEGSYLKPKDLLVFYGWVNSFNSATNGWNNESVANDMAKFGLVVLGDGIQDPGHGDYANTSVIVPRVKSLNPSTIIFGYVDATLALSTFQIKVDQWVTLGAHGIMVDKTGYDYGTNRAAFNQRVDYIHGKGKVAFINCWNTDHVLGVANDASYPNTTWNSGLVASRLNSSDWIMLESLAVNTDSYAGNDGYTTKLDWSGRISKAITLRTTFGVNFASVGIINDSNAEGQNLFNFAFNSALMASLEANGTSDSSYGAGSAATKFWTRPDVNSLGVVWSLNPSIQESVADSDIYSRFVQFGKFRLDFSTGAQNSDIIKW